VGLKGKCAGLAAKDKSLKGPDKFLFLIIVERGRGGRTKNRKRKRKPEKQCGSAEWAKAKKRQNNVYKRQ